MNATWKSQTFDAEGSTTAAGILRQLGRPSLDEFTILVREAAQNSWDARTGELDVTFSIRVERIGDRAPTWQRLLLPGPPGLSVPGFDQSVDADSWYLVVTDRGTGGLSGPIRATDRPEAGERNDFVQFLRNVGEPRDTALGGGTYGFGKGIFYRTSTVRTILADTQIRNRAGIERRFFGASLGKDFWDEHGRRHTGRHWWGTVNDGVVDPLVGESATRVASELGLPSFGADETGTSIVILGADLGLVGDEDEPGFADPTALGAHLASAVLWNLWPKFRSVAPDQDIAMNFSVIVDGVHIVIPEPASVPSLRPFAASAMSLGTAQGRSYRRTASPRIHVGDLAVVGGLAPHSESAVVSSARPFDGPPHHVARMRQAGLVVDYFPGPPHPDPLAAYGGVFRASSEADEYFAASEPPTHDRWNPEGLDKASRAVVDAARRWIRDDLNSRFAAAPGQDSESSSGGLGHGSRRLAGLVAAISATAPDPVGTGSPNRRGTGAAGASVSRSAAAHVVGDPWIDSYLDGLGVFVRVRVDDPTAISSMRGHFDIVLDGGTREAEAPRGADGPSVLGWIAAEDSTFRAGASLNEIGDHGEWIVVGELSDSVVTRFRLELTGVPGGA
ncbi:hypothetical protein J2Y46_003869 [Microbacterium sp. BE35]|uniref:hypothetical protein n=1 Tax=Microbacterium sp. BE35 TaxID=2817773 RepID=UPI00285C36A2|nr:hypothetical protein [Microbacterium sp. BE35]MDR7191011.1 hypothetical protein [Microbacterium sp. BE35]